MAINLLDLKPHVVSTDLSGYITLIYGPPKVGKSTFGARMPKPLLLAFERGYNAIPGVIAQDITSWGEMKQVMRELKKPEVQENFKSIVVDTIDIAADFAQKYVCNQLGIENIGDGGWTTNGWAKYKKEFEDVFRTLAQLGYAIVFISHDKEKTIKPQNGTEYQQIGSSMQSSALSIIENMADIIGYAHPKVNPDGTTQRVLTLRSLDNSIRCGCRFRYIEPEIPFSYEALTKALQEAINKEALENNGQYVTNERQTISIAKEYDFDALMKEFSEIAGKLMETASAVNGPKITEIISKYLGKGKKISEATREQAELVYLIVQEIKDTMLK
nr:MAG TPA: AAA domain protein [Caudoviricetes sp.]